MVVCVCPRIWLDTTQIYWLRKLRGTRSANMLMISSQNAHRHVCQSAFRCVQARVKLVRTCFIWRQIVAHSLAIHSLLASSTHVLWTQFMNSSLQLVICRKQLQLNKIKYSIAVFTHAPLSVLHTSGIRRCDCDGHSQMTPDVRRSVSLRQQQILRMCWGGGLARGRDMT